MYGESNVEIYNAMCRIESQWEFAVWLRGFRHRLCDRLKGRMGQGARRELQTGGDTGVPVADSC